MYGRSVVNMFCFGENLDLHTCSSWMSGLHRHIGSRLQVDLIEACILRHDSGVFQFSQNLGNLFGFCIFGIYRLIVLLEVDLARFDNGRRIVRITIK